MKLTKLAIVLLAAGIGAVLAWQLYFKNHNTHKSPYKTETLSIKDLTQYVTATGNLKVLDQITIGSLVTGRVIEIKVDDNDVVKKGQILAVLDNGIGYSAVDRAKAALDLARAQAKYQEAFYRRQEALYQSGQLAKNLFEQYTQDYEVALARVKQASADLEIENKTYNNLFIKSPADGIVIAKKIDLGQMVISQLSATVLFEIGQNLQAMEANVDVDEADIGMIKEGQECTFAVDAFPKERFSAHVKRIEFQAKIIDNVITYATVLDVKNPGLKLRPGMTTNVDIKIAHAEKALCIPNKALRVSMLQLETIAKKYNHTVHKLPSTSHRVGTKLAKNSDTLWVLENDTTIKQVDVLLGVNDGKYTQIVSGVDSTANVVVDVEEPPTENPLKSMFAGPGRIGK